MVRLKVLIFGSEFVFCVFQFLNGSIKRKKIAKYLKLLDEFQFLNGSIKSDGTVFEFPMNVSFQFLNGSIKS